jgi:putative N6-adenine-specific DNA methylase
MMALNIAPGSQRSFAFVKLKSFDVARWQQILQQAKAQQKPVSFQNIYASDMDLRAVRVAKQNLSQAGLLPAVQLANVEFTQLAAPAEQGVMVANPPYGVRLGEDEELALLYPKMAETLKRKFAGWTAYFLTSDLRLPKLMRLAPSKKTPLFNGPLECRLFEIKLVAGSNRRPTAQD